MESLRLILEGAFSGSVVGLAIGGLLASVEITAIASSAPAEFQNGAMIVGAIVGGLLTTLFVDAHEENGHGSTD